MKKYEDFQSMEAFFSVLTAEIRDSNMVLQLSTMSLLISLSLSTSQVYVIKE